jgi:hypothetical protein
MNGPRPQVSGLNRKPPVKLGAKYNSVKPQGKVILFVRMKILLISQ